MQVMEAPDVIGNDKAVGVGGWRLLLLCVCVCDRGVWRNDDRVRVGLCAGRGMCLF